MTIGRDFVFSGLVRSKVSTPGGVEKGPKLLNDETRPFRGASNGSVVRWEVWV